jgi:GNAT superfamily N-acetyltransferase
MAESSVRVIRRRPEHDDEIFALYSDVFGADGGARFRARWPWQYLENPNNRNGDPVHWIAVEHGHVIGHMSTMPFQMWWGDRELRAVTCLDQFVRKDARGRGLGLALVDAYLAEIDLGLALGMTTSSYPLFKKMFVDVGPVPAYLRALDATAVARRRLGAVAGAIVGAIAGVGLSLLARRRPRAAGLEVREVTGFSEEYTDLWTRARASFGSVIRRDAPYLSWKYTRCPYRQYRVLEARTRGTLSGYAIVRDDGDPAFRRGVIADLFCDTTDLATQDALLDAALDDFRRRGAARVESYCLHGRLGEAFRRHQFRAGRTALNYCIAPKAQSSAPLADKSTAQLVLGDGDLDRA